MNACLISIGDELLIGQTINTNAAEIGQMLLRYGVRVSEVITIGDSASEIKDTIDACLQKYSLVVTTGGLGPTKDDITMRSIAELLGQKLVFSQSAFDHLSTIIRAFGREPTEAHRSQCFLPEHAKLLHNSMGTAPGMHHEHHGHHLFVLPGVPYEMRAMVKDQVLPIITAQFPNLNHRIYTTFATVGEGESRLAEKIADIEETLPPRFSIAYLPGLGRVRIRLMAEIEDSAERTTFNDLSDRIALGLGDFLYAREDISLAEALENMLRKRNMTLAVAESCTGGYIGHLLTSIPGASDVFAGGGITYSNALKESLLGVRSETLTSHGAVSEETAREMAFGAQRAFGANLAVSVTGIAGPGGGSDEKPVGTVWIGVADGSEIWTRRFTFTKDRARNIELSAIAALNMVRKFLLRSA